MMTWGLPHPRMAQPMHTADNEGTTSISKKIMDTMQVSLLFLFEYYSNRIARRSTDAKKVDILF